MREATRAYVWTLHATYLDHVKSLPPGERALLPLVSAGRFTVAATAARGLHLIATGDPLPRPAGPEVEIDDEYDGTRWRLRFFDPSILPELGTVADDDPATVRRVLGVSDTLYHLTVSVGGGLAEHHAQHSGVALANSQASTWRDLERLRRLCPHHVPEVDELAACVRLGLDRSTALLVTEITDGRVHPAAGASADTSLRAALADLAR